MNKLHVTVVCPTKCALPRYKWPHLDGVDELDGLHLDPLVNDSRYVGLAVEQCCGTVAPPEQVVLVTLKLLNWKMA